ncbi:MAG: hypothetical protein IPM57_05610 [Oligoflexia bacterium]|nr:hypothetical protein [Oligoflexia bacterium]
MFNSRRNFLTTITGLSLAAILPRQFFQLKAARSAKLPDDDLLFFKYEDSFSAFAFTKQLTQKYTANQKKVYHMNGTLYLKDFISAIRKSDITTFREGLIKNHDVIIIDDIDFICRSESIYKEFRTLVWSALQEKKKIVVSVSKKVDQITYSNFVNGFKEFYPLG